MFTRHSRLISLSFLFALVALAATMRANALPSITSVSPASVTYGGATTPLVITGAGFSAVFDGTTSATLGSQTLTPTGHTNTTLTVNLTAAQIRTLGSGTFTLTLTNGVEAPTTSYTINAAVPTTALALTTGTNPSNFGASVTFTATVTGVTGAAAPSGSVQFKDNGTNLGAAVPLTGATTSATAALAIATLTGGSHSLTAVYVPDVNSNYTLGAASAALPHTVTKATPTTALGALTPSPSTFGDAVSVPITVTGVTGAAAPTGTVDLKEGATVIGTGTLSGATTSATVTLSVSTLSVGTHSLTAVYVPGSDPNYTAGAASTPVSQVVSKATPTVTVALTTGTNPSTFGSSVTFTATVTGTTGATAPTGTVQFKEGATILGTGPLSGATTSATATFSTSALAAGTHSITAVYVPGGDPNYTAGSVSAPLAHVVSKATPAVAVASSANPSIFGSPVTFTATVTSGAGTPTGTVQFQDNGTNLGAAVTLSSGTASTPAITTLTVGSHTITAVYSGDGSFNTNTGTLTQTVSKATPTVAVALTTGPSPSDYGDPLTFTATVTGVTGAAAPTGTVQFKEGATILGTGLLSGATTSATATFSIATLDATTHTITAVYVPGGDPNYTAGSPSPDLSQIVQPDATTISQITSSQNPANAGATVTFTVTVSNATNQLAAPTAAVQFSLDGTVLPANTVTMTAGPNAAYQTNFAVSPALTAGTHTLSATYINVAVNGVHNFINIGPSFLTQTVIGSTSVSVASSSNPSTYGEAVTFTATVTGAPSAGVPTGTVTFTSSDGTVLNSGNSVLVSAATAQTSTATVTTRLLRGGTDRITATYSGDGTNSAATAHVDQTVGKASPIIVLTLTGGSNPSNYGDPLTFTATVTGVAGIASPSGSVQFKDNGTNLGGAVPLTGGSAALNIATLTGGSHTITAVYSGDGNYTTRLSSDLGQTVNAASTATLTLTSSSPNNTSTLGDSVTFTATVPALSGVAAPTGTVTFTSSDSTVLNSGNAVTLDASGAATVTTRLLKAGADTITAAYSGDTNYAGSTAALTQTVNNVVPGPISLDPPSKPAGSGDFLLTITSSSLVGTPGQPFGGTVTFGGTVVTPVTFVSSTTLTVIIPNSLIQASAAVNPFPVVVTVSNPAPSNGPGSANFTVIPSGRPTLTSITPTSVAAGSSAFTMLLTGQNFQPNLIVVFRPQPTGNGAAVPFAPSVTPTGTSIQITLTQDQVNALQVTASTYTVEVQNPDGKTSEVRYFTLNSNPTANPKPLINAADATPPGLSPSSASVGSPDIPMIITGSEFVGVAGQSFSGTIKFNSTSLTGGLLGVDSTGQFQTLTVTVPAGLLITAGKYTVVVTNPLPSPASDPEVFTINNLPPAITTIEAEALKGITNLQDGTRLLQPFLNVPGTVVSSADPVVSVPSLARVLQITGTSFAPGLTVLFNGTPVPLTPDSALSGPVIKVAVPFTLLSQAGVAQIQVVNTDPTAGTLASAIQTFPINAVEALPDFPAVGASGTAANLRMFSVPYDYTGQSPLDTLQTITLAPALGINSPAAYDPTGNLLTLNPAGIDVTQEAFYRWDPTKPGYISADATTRTNLSIKIGQGYWAIRAPVADPLTHPLGLLSVGAPAAGNQFQISLQQGWNMIGDPFTQPVSFLRGLQVISNGALLPFFSVTDESAVSDGIVSPVLWSYDATAYVANDITLKLGSAGKPVLDSDAQLQPYEGYWLYSYQDATLLVTNTP